MKIEFKSIKSILLIGLLIAGLLGVVYEKSAGKGQLDHQSRPNFRRDQLTIHKKNNEAVIFKIELAETPQEESYGLMFVENLGVNEGMLFLMQDEVATFWMKNTFIPLDMLFIDQQGIIIRIVSHTKPLDLSPISSGQPVRAVLEIKGGEATRQGIQAGDQCDYAWFTSPK